MSELAIQLIEENKRTKAKFLDLFGCGLVGELPNELFECTWLENLNLSLFYVNENEESVFSRNRGGDNQISNIQFLKSLPNLQSLNLKNLGITNISFLEEFPNLQALNLDANKITDFSFLEKLTNLHTLDLSANKITDISFLEKFTNLHTLDLSVNKINDISFLEKLTNLHTLDLSDNEITDISYLEKLSNLKILNLGNKFRVIFFLRKYGNKIIDISFLAKLTNLHTLNLRHNEIDNISFLAKLTNLQTLDLSSNKFDDISFLEKLINLKTLRLSYNKIDNISFLEKLPNLQKLDLRYNTIDGSNPITNFRFLEKLTNLKSLDLGNNQICDINFLEKLPNLQTLDLSSNKIDDISFLEKLTNVQSLKLGDNQIANISFLEKLINLRTLDVQQNQISNISFSKKLNLLETLNLKTNHIIHFNEELLNSLPNLKLLDIRSNNIKNILPEIFDQENCLKDLKNYFKDKQKESNKLYESKVILVGNGRVGKTSVVKRLLDNAFNLNEKSTHAIQLRKWLLPELANATGMEKIQLNIWDFGGQDIYHATHRLFMKTQALFILVWDAQTEKTPEQTEVLSNGKKISYKNYPLLYWLSYIKSQSNNSPILIVQTKRDIDGRVEPSIEKKQIAEYNVCATIAVDCSKSTGSGFRTLHEKIEEIIADGVEMSCTEIPANWNRVRTKIADLQDTNSKQLAVSEFKEMCKGEELDESSMETLLKYLHNTGTFFYHHGIFSDQIVIDQQWAIDAVYRLFDRNGFFMNYDKGEFTGEDLEIVWKDYKIEERKLFVTFMEQCEICFEVDKQKQYREEIIFNKRRFISPQLLPDEKPAYITFAFDGTEGIYFKYDHRFLHSAVMARFIVRIGFLADRKSMWKGGVLIKTDEGTALIEAFNKECTIIIRIKGSNYTNLLDKIRNELKQITRYETEITQSVSLDGKNFVLLDSLKNHRAQNEEIQAENGTWVKFIDYNIFLNNDEKMRFDKVKEMKEIKIEVVSKEIGIPDDKRTHVFISYSHKDKKYLDDLKRHFKPLIDRVDFWDDTKIEAGEKWNSEIKTQIQKAKVAILLISADFFNSDFITKNELPPLLELAENGGAKILAIILKPCLWEEYPKVNQYQSINDPLDPISSMTKTSREQVWVDLVRMVKKIMNER